MLPPLDWRRLERAHRGRKSEHSVSLSKIRLIGRLVTPEYQKSALSAVAGHWLVAVLVYLRFKAWFDDAKGVRGSVTATSIATMIVPKDNFESRRGWVILSSALMRLAQCP